MTEICSHIFWVSPFQHVWEHESIMVSTCSQNCFRHCVEGTLHTAHLHMLYVMCVRHGLFLLRLSCQSILNSNSLFIHIVSYVLKFLHIIGTVLGYMKIVLWWYKIWYTVNGPASRELKSTVQREDMPMCYHTVPNHTHLKQLTHSQCLIEHIFMWHMWTHIKEILYYCVLSKITLPANYHIEIFKVRFSHEIFCSSKSSFTFCTC